MILPSNSDVVRMLIINGIIISRFSNNNFMFKMFDNMYSISLYKPRDMNIAVPLIPGIIVDDDSIIPNNIYLIVPSIFIFAMVCIFDSSVAVINAINVIIKCFLFFILLHIPC